MKNLLRNAVLALIVCLNLVAQVEAEQTGTSATTPPESKRILLPVNEKQQIYVTNVVEELKAKPGDVLVIPAGKEIKSIQLKWIVGTADKPIIVEGENPDVTIGGGKGYNVYIDDSKYFVVRKFNIDGKKAGGYGMHLIGSDMTVEDMVIRNIKGFGLQVKKDPVKGDPSTAWPQYSINNVVLRRIKVYDTTVEAFYIGHTNSQLKDKDGMRPAQIVGLIMEDLESHNTGWDGIQVSSARGIKGKNWKVENAGTTKSFGQNSGVTIQADTQVDLVENVEINGSTGPGLTILGRDVMNIKNVTIKNAGQDGIYVDDYPDPELKPLQLNLENITIDGAKRGAIKVANRKETMIPGTLKNITYRNVSEAISDKSHSKQINVSGTTTK